MIQITMILSVPNQADEDPDDSTGLTSAAYDRLSDAITEAGFEFEDGPTVVTG